jgi:hypothetical protein
VPDRGATRSTGRDSGDDGFSIITTVLSLLAAALLALLLLSTTLHSSATSGTSIANAPGVGMADDLVAQQALSSALTSVGVAASSAGGYGALDIASLWTADPAISFVAGPTSSPSTISVALTGAGGGAGVGGAGGAVTGGADAAGANGVGGDSGTVTLASHSTSGTCWLAWKSAGSATWYGAQTHLSTCTAPALASAPTPGPVTSSSIGWQPGSFPAG